MLFAHRYRKIICPRQRSPAQRLGERRRRFEDVREAEVLSHALERVRRAERGLDVTGGECVLELRHARVLQELARKACHHVVAIHQAMKHVVVVGADVLVSFA